MIHKKICAWCGNPIGLISPATPEFDDAIEESHGICLACLHKHFPQQAQQVIAGITHDPLTWCEVLEVRECDLYFIRRISDGYTAVWQDTPGLRRYKVGDLSDFDLKFAPLFNKV